MSVSRSRTFLCRRTIRRSMNSAVPKKDNYIFAPEREQYTKGALNVYDIDSSSPFPTFHKWFQEAKEAGVTADAVCLSTAELPSGRVSSRMVGVSEDGWLLML